MRASFVAYSPPSSSWIFMVVYSTELANALPASLLIQGVSKRALQL
jgi:hypothetical protein